MSVLSRICLALAGFLAVAGGVYGVTSHEPAGTVLLLVAAITFCFLGIVTRMVARASEGSEQRGRVEPQLSSLRIAADEVVAADLAAIPPAAFDALRTGQQAELRGRGIDAERTRPGQQPQRPPRWIDRKRRRPRR